MSVVDLERRGHVAVMTLDRPEARNAVDPQLTAELEQTLDTVEADERVRAVVLAGAPPSLCRHGPAGLRPRRLDAGVVLSARGGARG